VQEELIKSPSKAEIARQEKARLKQRAQQKKEMLERLKNDPGAAAIAAGGDVSACPLHASMACFHASLWVDHADLMLVQADRARNRLQFLLKQAEIFQHFVPESAKKEEKKKWVDPAASVPSNAADNQLGYRRSPPYDS
jgi:SWI/SNF-related matrix-associated actin-dependent regulator of chromatin subfamily A member 5